jgi:uncharacterized protein
MSQMPQLTRLRAENYRRMPWKNGGGETVEIAVSPEGAGLADFDWRISMATVATDGPFSVFPEIDRTLSILDGAGMTLFIQDRDAILLTRESAPLPFAADAATTAALADGPITDLNVMSRRGRIAHHVERLTVAGDRELPLEAHTALIFAENGAIEVTIGAEGSSLGPRDCLVVRNASGAAAKLSGQGVIHLVRLREI